MGMTLALGCFTNDPIRVPVALHGMQPLLKVPDDVTGYGLATSVDAHVVLKRVPMWKKGTQLEQLMNNKKGAFSVFQLRRASDVSPKNASGAMQMGPYKLRRYAAAVGAVPLMEMRPWPNVTCCSAACPISSNVPYRVTKRVKFFPQHLGQTQPVRAARRACRCRRSY